MMKTVHFITLDPRHVGDDLLTLRLHKYRVGGAAADGDTLEAASFALGVVPGEAIMDAYFFYSLIVLSSIAFFFADGSFVVQPPFDRATSWPGAFT